MWNRVLVRLGLVVVSLVATAILFELTLQIGSLFVDSPIDARHGAWETEDRRVLALGDSNTYGVWLLDRENNAYPAQLEKNWNTEQPFPIEVLNLGYPGINSSRLVGLYSEFVEVFAPDIVLVMIGVNDFWTQPISLDEQETDRGLIEAVKRHSRLYKGLYMLLRRSGADVLEIVDGAGSTVDRGHGEIRAGEHKFRLGWTTEIGERAKVEADLRDNLRKLAALSKRTSAQLVLMTYPGRFRYYSLANPAIREIAQETGIPLIDLTLEFEPRCPKFECPEWLYEDQHANTIGYRLVAETIVSKLPGLLR